ncbi:MAG: hypothetical protein ACE366_17030 [Bradymonadia bacterium]
MRTWMYVVCAGTLLSVSSAEAQNRRRSPAPVVTLDEMVVEGIIQKPEAFYILQRRELEFKDLEPKKSFLPLILKSVEKDPF